MTTKNEQKKKNQNKQRNEPSLVWEMHEGESFFFFNFINFPLKLFYFIFFV